MLSITNIDEHEMELISDLLRLFENDVNVKRETIMTGLYTIEIDTAKVPVIVKIVGDNITFDVGGRLISISRRKIGYLMYS